MISMALYLVAAACPFHIELALSEVRQRHQSLMPERSCCNDLARIIFRCSSLAFAWQQLQQHDIRHRPSSFHR